MLVVQPVLQVCCYISLMLPINSYVLFAANVEDFRNLAKRFIPDELAEKLTDLVSQSGNKSLKDRAIRNEGISVRQNLRERTAATINDDTASTDMPMDQIRGGKRQTEQSNQKSQIKFEYDEIQYTTIASIQNINKPVSLEPKPNDKRFKQRPPIQVHVDFEDEQQNESPKIKQTINNSQIYRIPIANMKKRHSEDSSEKKRPIHNQQETLQNDYVEDNVYKKSNFESRFDNAEQKNSYVNKMPANQNGDRPKRNSKYPHDSRYESEELSTEEKKNKNELTTVKYSREPKLDYDYDDTTTKVVTLVEKRYRTIRGRISSKNSQDLSVMKLKETFSRAATPKEKLDLRERVVKQRQRTLRPTATTPERDYDMRQKKVTPKRKVEFGNREHNNQGRENEMRIQNGREIRDRKRQKQKALEDDQRYEKTYTPKLTNNDYDLPYERPHPSKPTNNDYDLPYKRLHPAKPTKDQNDLRYKRPHPSKPTKNDYDLPYEKPYPSKPTKNDYDLPYEKPYPSKPTKNDYDNYYEKPNPSKQTNNDYDLNYEKSQMRQPTTSNYNKILLTKQNTPVKDDDYFDDDNLNPTVKIPRMPGANIQHKPAQKDEIFASAENPSVPSIKKKKNISNLGAKRPVANERRPVANEKRPVADAEDQEMYAEVVHEPVKARTENLNFDVDYDNNTGRIPTTRHIMKGTGIPTRQTYKMSSPDYYKRLPRIVEKYDFSEAIPEADRVREVANDKLVVEQGRVNMKVKQQKKAIFKEAYEERPEFEPEPVKGYDDNNDNIGINDQQGAIMEEFSLVR